MSECVKVVVRCRPMNNREKDLHSKSVVYMDSSLGQCSIVHPGDASAPPKTFSFDGVYFTESTTETLYNDVAYPLVEGVLEGYNSTVFAYGQTGCGKSYTMQGVVKPPSQKGIIPRAFEHIFEAIETSDDAKFLVHASYLEIYNEEIRDLLGKDCKKKLDLKEHPDRGVYIQELSQHAVHNVAECEAMMEAGWKNRATGATLMNADSSRSHSIFTINVEMLDGNTSHIRRGKLNLVDLAGSERQTKTGATGDRLKEATKINLSLSALGNVISALVDGKSKHIPYRDSKLTRLLQDSLGGNTKTLMVACISPADNNYDETLSTLRYANRAKNIKNKPRINQDPKDALLSQYQDEIRQLKELLENGGAGGGDGNLLVPVGSVEAEKEKIRQEYETQLQQLRQSYESEKQGKARLQADVQSLKDQYEKELKGKQEGAPHNKGQMGRRNSTVVPDANLTPEQHEALARLQAIETNMVGGEKADDLELLEKRQKKKKAAEKRSKVLAESLNKNDEDDSLLIKAYDNIQEELRAKTDALKKTKQKIRALEREVSDLYSEFQSDRTDYLETIRRQDQQLKLLQAILDKIHPTVRRDCNYINIDNIKSEAVWSDETQRWKLPDLLIVKTKLPPASLGGMHNKSDGGGGHKRLGGGGDGGGNSGNSNLNNGRVPSKTAPPSLAFDNEEDDDEKGHSVLLKKFEKCDKDDFTENYFKPKRATELIIKAQQDASRVSSKWADIALKLTSSNGGTNGNILSSWNNNNNYNNAKNSGGGNGGGSGANHSWGPSPVQSLNNGWGSAGGGTTLINGFLSSPDMNGSLRRPAKLEALPLEARQRALKKMKQGTPPEFAQG